jgi:hypothetical protein
MAREAGDFKPVIDGTRTAKTKDDPSLRMRPGDLEGTMRILSATKPEHSDYLKAWFVDYIAYIEHGPCPCCGQPRGAGSLHA